MLKTLKKVRKDALLSTLGEVALMLTRTGVFFCVTIVVSIAAFFVAALVSTLARAEMAELAYRTAFWLAFAALVMKFWPIRTNVDIVDVTNPVFWEYALPYMVGVGLGVWAVVQLGLPLFAEVVKTWGLF